MASTERRAALPRLYATHREGLHRLVRFGITGVANTLVNYLTYRLFLLVVNYQVANLVAWAVAVTFSFFMNARFTFRTRPTWSKFVRYPATSLVNLLFTSVGSLIAVNLFHADQRYITLIMGILAIPATYALTKFILKDPPGDLPDAAGATETPDPAPHPERPAPRP
ncbi:GtrA family protein [Micrococcus sp.]|uniref:GtrA family protein n=1 Tax=Micrococcus sp. TaxID=1271 RepID=UPI002A91FA70|nr:GtrA family protein [Micrococcus sp.]MDY6054451.1 GtrA family protein [Micrococcus sp.]